jgi:phage-related protein
MASGAAWTIEYYIEQNGNCPVIDFIEGLDTRAQLRIAKALEKLEAQGANAKYPLVSPVRGKIWELRVGYNKTIYRILYFIATGRVIVLLHGIPKKTQELPEAAIRLAEARMKNRLGR